MTERLRTICGLLPPAEVFADVGCDHGYCTKYMFDHALTKRAYMTDISAKSLKKAQTLLKQEIEAGKCIPVVCSGLDGVEEPCDLVLIAGLGGEEILSVLARRGVPEKFVLQPMKNAEKVRRFLAERGAHIEKDFVFSDRGKYYDVLCGTAAGGSAYTGSELRWGRDNLRGNEVFLRQAEEERAKLISRLKREMRTKSREALLRRLAETEEAIHETQRNLSRRG